MTVIISVVALFLAAILGLSAAHKLVERVRLASATGDLLRLHAAVAIPITMAAAAVEVAAALALVFPASRPVGAAMAALVWSIYAVALVAARQRGDIAIDCGCDFGKRSSGIGGYAIGRAFALVAVALVLCVAPASEGGLGIDSLFAALGFLALYFAAGEIAQISVSGRSFAR